MSHFSSLRTIGGILVFAAFALGALSLWIWVHSSTSWRDHQNNAYVVGVALYSTLQNGTAAPKGVTIQTLDAEDQAHAAAGRFRQLKNVPTSARITIVPISPDVSNQASGDTLSIVILSPDITYKLANLTDGANPSAALITGALTRQLASLCSDPTFLAKIGDGLWKKIDGSLVWGCAVAPADRRLFALILAVLSLGIMTTLTSNLSSGFSAFANQLRNRHRVGGPTSYDTHGPQELRDIVTAVNNHLDIEHAQLVSRAAVLSGVSHDLGTPATRLRLRTALISDAELRQKFETDIDSMTGLIESVLTYTHAEMNTEKPRRLSLSSLVEAIVDDYQDTGRPVKLRKGNDVVLHGGRSIFMSRQGKSTLSSDRDIIIYGRPISLQRAITNLIENAIKYGRRANVTVEATSDTATIVIEDEGSESIASEIEALMEPFQRGENTATVDGYGLGLTIVSTIAKQHGGSLTFEDKINGVAARFSIQRN